MDFNHINHGFGFFWTSRIALNSYFSNFHYSLLNFVHEKNDGGCCKYNIFSSIQPQASEWIFLTFDFNNFYKKFLIIEKNNTLCCGGDTVVSFFA